MDQIVIMLGILFWPLFLFFKYTFKYLDKQEANKNFEIEFNRWLIDTEPKYREFKRYPPDWWNRKLYMHRLHNFTCQICGTTRYPTEKALAKTIKERRNTIQSGLHVHHKKPLSKGGNNAFENLICLCEECHQNQHPHMLRTILKDYKLKASRARTAENISYWNNLVAETQSRLEKSEKIKY